MREQIHFEVISKLGKRIRTTIAHWNFIIDVKHLEIRGQEERVKKTLQDPDIISISQEDKNVYLYYRKSEKYYLCVVARHQNGEGFIITVYFTDKIKEGEVAWRK